MSWVSDIIDSLGFQSDAVIDLLGPQLLQYGIESLLPGFTDPQRQMAGYQGGIPEYVVQRERVPGTYDPNRRPGSGGQRYFTDVQYVPAEGAAGRTPLTAGELAALNVANPAQQQRVPMTSPNYYAGGIATMAQGRYLNGNSDGMADQVPARIDGMQEARLSDGEFVIPADVVSHFGNGNSEAGARELYAMMDRVRKARTGTTKQGKQINPSKMLPA
jgi:hypothetical protein